MSKFNLIAVAIAATLAAPAAFAVTLTDGSTPGAAPAVTVSHIDITTAANAVVTGDIAVNIQATDLIIGRTTGFSVRFELPAGTTFGADAPATLTAKVGGALEAAPAAAWVITRAAGGLAASNDSVVVYSVQPAAGSTGVKAGEMFKTPFTLKGVTALATVGGTVSATVKFADPNTSTEILSPVTAVLLKSADPLAYSVSASLTPAKKIDVGSLNALSKTRFSSNGTINATGGGSLQTYFSAGAPAIAAKAGVNGATGTAFVWHASDTAVIRLDGNFSAFTQTGASVFLVDKVAAHCGDTLTAGEQIKGVVTSTSVTFPSTAINKLSGEICFSVPATNAVAIAQTKIDTTVTASRDSIAKGKTTAVAAASPMMYNGPVAYVDHFNPASNADQQSYLRISNTSGSNGSVSISGVCDSGVASLTPASLVLAANKSVLLTSTDLEIGNAAKGMGNGLGACAAGKYRLTVTGEFPDMQVQNFLRNVTSGGMINTNINNRDSNAN